MSILAWLENDASLARHSRETEAGLEFLDTGNKPVSTRFGIDAIEGGIELGTRPFSRRSGHRN